MTVLSVPYNIELIKHIEVFCAGNNLHSADPNEFVHQFSMFRELLQHDPENLFMDVV